MNYVHHGDSTWVKRESKNSNFDSAECDPKNVIYTFDATSGYGFRRMLWITTKCNAGSVWHHGCIACMSLCDKPICHLRASQLKDRDWREIAHATPPNPEAAWHAPPTLIVPGKPRAVRSTEPGQLCGDEASRGKRDGRTRLWDLKATAFTTLHWWERRSRSKFALHYTWRQKETVCKCKMDVKQCSRLKPSNEFRFEGLTNFTSSVEGIVQIQDVNPRI